MVKVLEEREIEAQAQAYEDKLRADMGLESETVEHFERPEELRFTRSQRDSTTILFGGLTLAHDELTEEALIGLGYKVRHLLPPDNEALRIGSHIAMAVAMKTVAGSPVR